MELQDKKRWELDDFKVEKLVTSTYKGVVSRYLLSKKGLCLIKKEKVVICVAGGDVRCVTCPGTIEVEISYQDKQHKNT